MSFGLEKPTCLKQMGFSEEEIAYYERLIGAGEGSERDRILMISEKRRIILGLSEKRDPAKKLDLPEV